MSNLVWFRNDLRVTDNQVLKAACAAGGDVIGVYIFDPIYYENSDFNLNLDFKLPFTRTGAYRAQFIREALIDLKEQLAAYNIPLVVVYESAENVIADLVEKHNISTIFYQREWTRDEKEQEHRIKNKVQALKDVTFNSYYDQFLFHPDDIPFEDFSELPRVFTDFRKKCEKQSKVRESIDIKHYSQDKIAIESTKIPSLEQLGLSSFKKDARSAFPWAGGETSAWERLDDYFWETGKLQYYKKTRNGLESTDYSSKFSAWLAIGCISARSIYWQVKKFEKEVKKNQDTYWLVFELIWRDFFKYVSLKNGEDIFKIQGILNKDYEWKSHKKALSQWMHGNTDEPFVNANMKELAATGFMSNRGRQNVASYWSMHQEQDWRIGAAYFEHILIDYDVHSNYGNWMYNSGVGNDPRNRTFNIKSQAERYDNNGSYRRLWLQDELF